MRNFGDRSTQRRRISPLHNLVQLRQAETAHHLFLRFRRRNKAAIVLHPKYRLVSRPLCFRGLTFFFCYCALCFSRHNTSNPIHDLRFTIYDYISSTCLPRKRASSMGSFIRNSASNVARTTLCGLVDPNTLVLTSRTPTACITARTAPPAITPVPSDAGLTMTRPAPNLPINWCGRVFLIKGTRIRFFLAASMAFLIASGTSRALPVPKPTWPPSSPTTTRAANDIFLPPFTTLVTRLIEMTWSFRSSPCD